MAHWKEAAVTNDGAEMLNEWMAGRKITITSAYGGTGTVDPDLLAGQTGLVDMRQKLHLLGEKNGADGKTVQVQVQNAGVMTEYELNQVGVYAALDVDRDPDAEERLLFIMQDEKGVTIPAAVDASFLLELYCIIGITNNGRFEVSVSSAGIATMEAVGEAVQEHNEDPEAHAVLMDRIRAAEIMLNGGETISGNGIPTAETEGLKGQHYIDQETGTEFVCTGVTEEGYGWEPWETVDKSLFAAQLRLTGQPGQIVGFDASGAAQAVQGWSNRNLLDNWDFADPINQRGQEEYVNDGYTIDRWRSARTKVSIEKDGLGIQWDGITAMSGLLYAYNYIEQFEPGQNYTFSALVKDIGLICVTASMLFDRPSVYTTLAYSPNAAVRVEIAETPLIGYNVIQCSIRTYDAEKWTIKAAKLEKGIQQTLAHQDENGNWVLNDSPPDKALELAKCQRYQVELCSANTHGLLGIGLAANSTAVNIFIPLPMTMRSHPTVSFSGNIGLLRSNNASFIAVNNMVVQQKHENGVMMAVTPATNVSAGDPFGLYVLEDSNASLLLDANL